MTTLSTPTEDFTPIDVRGIESTRASRNVIHNVLGSNAPSVTLREAGLRTGTLGAMVETAAEAAELEAALSTAVVWELEDATRPEADMFFVVTDEVSVDRPADLGRYLVSFGYQEVSS